MSPLGIRAQLRRSRLAVIALVSLVALVVTGTFLSARRVGAADGPVAGPPEIRKIYVPADKLAELSRGYEPIGREDFEALLRGVTPQPEKMNTVWINRATFRAELDGETLRNGRLNAQIESRSVAATLLELEPLNFNISRLRWTSASPNPEASQTAKRGTARAPIVAARPEIEALWGTTAAGRLALLVDRPTGTITGDWELKGRRLAHGVEFELRFPPAAVCDVEFVLSDDQVLRTSAGDVLGPAPADRPGRKLWRLHPGQHSICKIVISSVRPTGDLAPQIAYESNTQCAVHNDGAQIEARITAEIFAAPTDQLHLDLPADMEIDAVSYGGAGEFSLPWQSEKLGARQRVTLRLPEAVIGPTRLIRVDGFAPVRLEQKWTLPQVALEGAVFVSGQYQLKIDRPLELRSFDDGHGYRAASAVSSTRDAETFQFRQLKRDASLSVDVSRPRLTLAARVVSRLSIEPESWSIRSDIDWQASAGSAFELQCSLPAGWEISDVVPRSEDSVVTNWEVKADKDGARVLNIEFLKEVGPDDPKRVRIMAGRVPLPAGEPLKLSTLEPRDCTGVDEWIIVTHPRNVSSSLGAESEFRQMSEDQLPASFRESPLWNDVAAKTDVSRLVLNASGPDAVGTIAFETRERALESRVTLRVDVTRDKLREDDVIDIVPQGEIVESLHVFASKAGSPLEWSLVSGAETTDLQPRRVPHTTESRWNLPAEGELWEFRLSEPQSAPFRIQAQRTGSVPQAADLGLLFVPGSRSFTGRVEWNAATDIDVEPETTGMHSEDPPQAERLAAENDPLPVRTSRRVWTYDNMQDAFRFRVHAIPGNEKQRKFAALRLRSQLSPPGAGQDHHIAEFVIDPDSQPGPFRFRMPVGGVLLSVRLNGQTIRPTRQVEELVIPALERREANTVEVEYHADSGSAWLKDTRDIALVTTSHEVLKFEWEFELPAGHVLYTEPAGMSLDEELPKLPWTARLFGALARPADAAIFNPMRVSTWSDFGTARNFASDRRPEHSSSSEALVDADTQSLENSTPVESNTLRRSIWHARSHHLPETLSLTVWHVGRSRLLAWIAFLATISIGLVARLISRPTPTRLVDEPTAAGLLQRLGQTRPSDRWLYRLLFAWITALLVAAVLLPPVAAVIVGSVFIGTLLALAVPIRWFASVDALAAEAKRIPIGSTATLVRGSASSAILIGAGLVATGWAQEPANNSGNNAVRDELPAARPVTPAAAKQPSLQAQPAEAPMASRYSILIPVDGDGQPEKGEQSLVYAPPRLIQLLRSKNRSQSQGEPGYLITSAEYRGVVDVRQSATIEARYRVALVGHADNVRIELPISNVNLDAADGCKVNGRPQPILSGPAGNGYLVDVARRRPTDASASADSESVEIAEIVLKMYPIAVANGGGSGFRMEIPHVPSGEIQLRFSDGAPPQQVTIGRDRSPMSRSGDSFSTSLGRNQQLEIAWSGRSSQSHNEVDASIIRFVSVHSTRLEYRYRVACRVLQGRISSLDFDVPRGSFVRSVAEGLAYRWSAPGTASKMPRLRIYFPEPREQDFAVDFSLMLPIDSADGEIHVPLIGPFGAETDTNRVKVVLNEVGVSTGSEYRLIPASHESDRVSSLAPDSPLKKECLAIGLRDPELAYHISTSTDLVVRLAPLTPLRKINVQTQEGTIGQNRLDWRLTAEIRTENAPAFVHRLAVDQRLKIESISVQEDNAERLVRWSRDGEFVNLFLRDRTTATQDLVLLGSMPLPLSTEVPLPLVRVEDATVAQSRLVLNRDPRIAVELGNISGLIPADAGSEARRASNSVLIGQYMLNSERDLPTLRLVPRNERLRADFATLLSWGNSRSATMTTVFRVHGTDRPTRPLRLRIPKEIGVQYQLHAPGFTPRTQNQDDGSVEITLESPGPATESTTITVTASVNSPEGTDTWTLPRVAAVDAAEGDNYLLVSSERLARPANSSAIPIGAEELPAWISAAGATTTGQRQWDAFALRGPAQSQEWSVKRDANAAPIGRSHTPLVRTFVDMSRDGEQSGITQAVVVEASGRPVEFNIPNEVQTRALFVNGRPTTVPAGNPISIPLDSGTRPQTVVLYWTRQVEPLAWSGSVTAAIPQPVPAAANAVFILSAPAGRSFMSPTEALSSNEAEQSAITAEGLLQAIRANTDDQATIVALWPSLTRLREEFRTRLDADRAPNPRAVTGAAARVRQRMESAVARIDDLVPIVARTAPAGLLDRVGVETPAGSFDIEPVPGNRALLYGRLPAETEAAMPLARQFDAALVRVVIGLLLVPIILFAGWRLVGRLDEVDRNRYAPIGWGLLGIVWWAFLVPSIIGAAILAAAVVAYASRRKTPKDLGSQRDSFALHA